MQLLSRTMGKEANMGGTSFRNNFTMANPISFPLTSLKEEGEEQTKLKDG